LGKTIAQGTSSITLEFIVGYGGNAAPTGTPTLTVDGSSAGTVTCLVKTGHNNCTAVFSTASLAAGTYTITATVPADGTYSTTSGSAVLTVIGNSSSSRLVGLKLTNGAAPTTNPGATKQGAAPVVTTKAGAVRSAPAVVIAPMVNFAPVSNDDALRDDTTTTKKKEDAAK